MTGPLDVLIARLVQRLRDHDPVVRFNAVGALRLHGARALEAIPDLATLTADEHPKVRAEAQRTLDQLRQPAA